MRDYLRFARVKINVSNYSSKLFRFQEGFKEPYNWDEYAQVFFPKAEELVSQAEEAEREGNKERASELYLYVALSSDHEISKLICQASLCGLPYFSIPSPKI